jgi:hypothetical protein
MMLRVNAEASLRLTVNEMKTQEYLQLPQQVCHMLSVVRKDAVDS